MQKLDLKRDLTSLYSPSARTVELLDVPALQFIQIDGAIETGQAPGSSPLFQEYLSALYGLAYTLKFTFKKRPVGPVDYPVMALEGLWWVEDGLFDIQIKDNWFYTLMIHVPQIVTQAHHAEAVTQLRKKKGEQPVFSRLRLGTFTEGLSIQTLHIGPYVEEPASVARMEAFAAEHGYVKRGRHHEIYLGDPLRADPAKLRTILRHPVERGPV